MRARLLRKNGHCPWIAAICEGTDLHTKASKQIGRRGYSLIVLYLTAARLPRNGISGCRMVKEDKESKQKQLDININV